VVIGGSVAGLLAAAAAARHFECVTVLERDRLTDGPVTRKGSPQGNQIHILLPIGERYIDELFPGIHADCVAEGCSEANHCSDIASLGKDGWRLRLDSELMDVIGFRRPLLEWIMRRRLGELGNVEIRHATADGLAADGANVTGVRLKAGETVAADLVVDAAGRGSRAPRWVRELGFDRPEEDEVRIYMGYATQFIRIPEGTFEGGVRGMAAGATPDKPIGAVMLPADNGVHSLAAMGFLRNYPPADREGFLRFLDGVSSPLIGEIYRASEPVSRINVYKQPGNLLRHWERLERRPGRFVVVGDAVASFNPAYGQGMTMAALAGTLLDETLGDTDLDDVAGVFHERLRPGVELAFSMAANADAGFEGAEFKNFEPPPQEDQTFGKRLGWLAGHDPDVLAATLEAFFWLRPEAIQTDEIKRKVAEAGDPPDDPGPVDPRDYPRTTVNRRAAALVPR
jgi:2-polyprenyl-6-methoxyphenol hydroxylase-like FAD-dependent oxidoreductase